MKRKVLITGKEAVGLFRKRMVYKAVIVGSPGVSGKSTNKKLERVYHRGEEVTANVSIFVKDQDEYMTFEILEEEEGE